MMNPLEAFSSDLAILLRSKHSLIWVATREEGRAERGILTAAAAAKLPVRFWDCADGITAPDRSPIDASTTDPAALIQAMRESSDRFLMVMRDAHRWFDPVVLRRLRSAARDMAVLPPSSAKAIVLLCPEAAVPPELLDCTTLIRLALPDRSELESLCRLASPAADIDRCVDAAVGLAYEEAASCFAKSLAEKQSIEPHLVAAEKRRVVERDGLLTWFDPEGDMDSVGGMDAIKKWLLSRRVAFSQDARRYGLPLPRGVLIFGVPGCGKSMIVKALACSWGMPLLRMDMGALRSKYVGESEQRFRAALAVADAVAPCVVWIDEIEKAVAGSSGRGDGGVAADALGTLLTWMQDHKSTAFVAATANDVESLPIELTRQGRFDAMFFVDLPSRSERISILSVSIARAGHKQPTALGTVADATAGFSGAELAGAVSEALFNAFSAGAKAVTSKMILDAASEIVPMSKYASGKIDQLRVWARGRARVAGLPEEKSSVGRFATIGAS